MNHPPSVVKYEQPMTRRRTASSTDKSYNVGGGGDAAAAPDNAVIIAAHPHDKDSFPKLELKAAANPSFPALDVGAAIPNSSPMEKAAGAQENPKKLHWTQKRQQVKVACGMVLRFFLLEYRPYRRREGRTFPSILSLLRDY